MQSVPPPLYLLRTLVFIVARDERDSQIVLDVSVCERPPRVFPSVSARDLFGPARSGAAIKYLDALWLRARARSAQKRGLPLAMQHTQGVVMKTGFLARASFRNKSVALETDQIETPSVRHRRPRISAALLAGVGLVLTVGGSRLLMLGGSLYYVVAGLSWVLSGVFLWRGRRLGSLVYGGMLLGTLQVVWTYRTGLPEDLEC